MHAKAINNLYSRTLGMKYKITCAAFKACRQLLNSHQFKVWPRQMHAAKAYSRSSTSSLSGVFTVRVKTFFVRASYTLPAQPSPKPSAAASYQPLVPGEDDGVEHGLVEEAIAHPLRDDNVHLLHGQLHLLHLALEDGNDCGAERATKQQAANYCTASSPH